MMKARFQPESTPPDGFPGLEGLDASEEMFAASLNAPPERPVFTVNADEETGPNLSASENENQLVEPAVEVSEPGEVTTKENSVEDITDSWKQEVTARVSRYRSRRPRTPRYPSLLLKFENAPPEMEAEELRVAEINLQSVAAAIVPQPNPVPVTPEITGRVIEFPRATLAPPRPLEELAEPVPDRPRILDVPEAPAPPPALGGILIEGIQSEEPPRRPGFEIPLQAASMTRRILASVVDIALICCALVEFGYIFLRITHLVPPPLPAAAMLAVLSGLLWMAYQYAFLVYRGTTPGLLLMRLRLSCFDGRPVLRKTRRWRALTSMLSAGSIGLGYLWSFLDEDQLCWHDRITTTYMAPKPAQTQISK